MKVKRYGEEWFDLYELHVDIKYRETAGRFGWGTQKELSIDATRTNPQSGKVENRLGWSIDLGKTGDKKRLEELLHTIAEDSYGLFHVADPSSCPSDEVLKEPRKLVAKREEGDLDDYRRRHKRLVEFTLKDKVSLLTGMRL